MKTSLKLILFFTLFTSSIHAYNFLVVSPVFGYSHMKFMSKVADTLANGGHQVTLLQTYIYEHFGKIRMVKNKNIEPMFVLYNEFKPMCDKVLSDKKLHEWIVSKKFDGFVAESFDFCSLYLGDHLKQNLLPMFSTIKNVAASHVIGEPSLLQYAPSLHTSFGADQTVLDRIQDITAFTSFHYAFANLYDRQFSQAHGILNGEVRNWKEILQTATFYFYNNNPYVGFPMPKLEKSVEIGGLTVDPTKEKLELDEEYEKILELRGSTVLISFGTVVQSSDMPTNFKEGIIKMFRALPDTTFIWKYEVDDVEFSRNLPENVILKKWVPQPALIADKRVNLFITHGGLGSTLEVAYAGKPSLMIPIFGDQMLNAKMLSRHGGSKSFDKYDLPNSAKLTELVKEIITNESFNTNALLLAEILKNQPIDPRQNLLKHAEFCARFGRVRSLEPYSVHYNFIQYYMLDAWAIIILLIFLVLYVAHLVVKMVYRRFCKRGDEKTKNE